MPNIVESFSCATASDLLSHLSAWTTSHNLERYVYRGHSDSAYQLIPTALRPSERKRLWHVAHLGMPMRSQADAVAHQQSAEWHALRRFYRLADRNGLLLPDIGAYRRNLNMEFDFTGSRNENYEYWLPEHLFEIAGLAQHYGLPTRLLDWTYDPLTACHFAAYGKASDSGYLDVWALNHEWLTYIGDTVDRTGLRFVTPPYFGNPNLAAQRGLFSVWLEPYVDFLRPDAISRGLQPSDLSPLNVRLERHFAGKGRKPEETLLICFRLPESQRDQLQITLRNMGYGKGRLFPGYRGVVEQLFDTGWTEEPL